tara:strand:- start:270546 stop:271448 length:903 start_codon:yes stop_codon:yes gene_type:complete
MKIFNLCKEWYNSIKIDKIWFVNILILKKVLRRGWVNKPHICSRYITLKNNKMIFKKLKFVSAALLSIVVTLFTACEKNNDLENRTSGQLNMKASAIFSGPSAKTSVSKDANGNVQILEFLANISEIELEFDDDFDSEDDDGYFGYDDEVELEGPFELNLLSSEAVFTSANIPNGTYEEIEFEFEKSRDSSSELFGKTILIKGLIEDVPFEFWYDMEVEVEVDFDDSNVDITVSSSGNEITILFDLNEVFDIASGIDLTSAQDGNGDGLIEISPNDDDGNRNLARRLKEKLEESIELLDD